MHDGKRILIIQTAYPGDAILSLPLIQELSKKKSGYLIDVLCIPQTEEIFKASPFVHEVVVYDKKGKQKSIMAFIKFLKEFKSNNYNLVYSPHRSFRSALIALNLHAKETVGFDRSSLVFAYKRTVKYDPSVHEVKRNLAFIDGDYSGDKWRIIPEIISSTDSKEKVQKFLTANKINKFIAIAPGSVWETKKYPVEHFKSIIDHFVNKEYKIILMGSNQDITLCESLQTGYNEKVFIAAGYFSMIESIELLKSASILICNDSAPTHLGMCADMSVLTIYCSTIPDFGFYPYNKKSHYISYDELMCKPCGIHGFRNCPVKTFDCGKLLLPVRAIEKAESLISDYA